MALKPITDEEISNLLRLQKELPEGYLVLTATERAELRTLLRTLRGHVPYGERQQALWQEATAAIYLLESK